jgi:hypothetical protein
MEILLPHLLQAAVIRVIFQISAKFQSAIAPEKLNGNTDFLAIGDLVCCTLSNSFYLFHFSGNTVAKRGNHWALNRAEVENPFLNGIQSKAYSINQIKAAINSEAIIYCLIQGDKTRSPFKY